MRVCMLRRLSSNISSSAILVACTGTTLLLLLLLLLLLQLLLVELLLQLGRFDLHASLPQLPLDVLHEQVDGHQVLTSTRYDDVGVALGLCTSQRPTARVRSESGEQWQV